VALAPVLAVAGAAVLALDLQMPVLAVARAAVLAIALPAPVLDGSVARAAVLAAPSTAPPRRPCLQLARALASLHVLLQNPQLHLVPPPLPLACVCVLFVA
jgi:hypothetical protein